MKQLDESLLLDLVGLIYTAAADPEQWPNFHTAFGRAVNSPSVTLLLHDFADGSAATQGNNGSLAVVEGIAPEFLASYAAHFSRTNVWLKNEAAIPEGQVLVSSEVYPDSKLTRTEYHNDWLQPQDLFYSLGTVVAKRDHLSVMLTTLRAKSAGAYGETERAFTQRLVPHLQRAVALHRRLAHARLPGQAALASLALLSSGVWLLGSDGALLYANAAAEKLIRCGNVLTLGADGRPHARLHGEDARLQRLIDGTLLTGLGRGVASGGTRALMGLGGAGLHILVTPLIHGGNAFGSAAAAIFACDPATLPINLEVRITALYGLTPAEARLAVALVAGESIAEYASRMAISQATARTHLKNILQKTGARRQAELMRIIVGGPAMLVTTDG